MLKLKNSAGQILGFHRFRKKYSRAISVSDVTDDLCSEYKADLYTARKDTVSSKPGSQKVILKIFMEYFVVCPAELKE